MYQFKFIISLAYFRVMEQKIILFPKSYSFKDQSLNRTGNFSFQNK